MLIDYCALNIGYVNVNKAGEAELKKYGGFSAAEATAIVAARTAGTLFTSLDELKAVPGIDGSRSMLAAKRLHSRIDDRRAPTRAHRREHETS